MVVPVWARPLLFRSLFATLLPSTAVIRLYRNRRTLTRGNDLWHEMKASGVLEKTVMVFGQMNEPPGVRLRVGLTGLTMAEYFRDTQHMDVLLSSIIFIDTLWPAWKFSLCWDACRPP